MFSISQEIASLLLFLCPSSCLFLSVVCFTVALCLVKKKKKSSTCLCVELAKCTLHAGSHNQPLLSSACPLSIFPSIHLDSRYMGASVEMDMTSAIFVPPDRVVPGFFHEYCPREFIAKNNVRVLHQGACDSFSPRWSNFRKEQDRLTRCGLGVTQTWFDQHIRTNQCLKWKTQR